MKKTYNNCKVCSKKVEAPSEYCAEHSPKCVKCGTNPDKTGEARKLCWTCAGKKESIMDERIPSTGSIGVYPPPLKTQPDTLTR